MKQLISSIRERFPKLLVTSLVLLNCTAFQSIAQDSNQSDAGNMETEGTPEVRQSDAGNTDVNPDNETPDSEDPEKQIDPKTIDINPTKDYADKFGPFYGDIATTNDIAAELAELGAATGTNPGLIYIVKQNSGLRLVLVTSNQDSGEASPQASALVASTDSIPATPIVADDPSNLDDFSESVVSTFVPNVSSKKIDKTVKGLIRRVSDPSNLDSKSYLKYSQQLYDWMIRPLNDTVEARGVDTLIFVMDRGLRTFPVSVLHDGENFLVEKYNLSLIPSFSLTDTRYKSVDGTQMLGLGISESVQGLSPLPSVSLEVPTLTQNIWQGEFFLNEGATLSKLQNLTSKKEFDIIHLATHAEFKPGDFSNSFIQLWDQRVSLRDLREVAKQANWSKNPTIELIVLSACQTAIGNLDAELGFSGLALQTGAKSALGSLWYVSDEGTLALMSEFYTALSSAPIKSAALRDAQLSMLNGETLIEDNKLKLSSGLEVDLPSQIQGITRDKLNHPYYWSSFTLVGNWN